ncbi:MAG: hypothetical protein QGG01_05375, partial [Roseibacillus sp.]|nr:hypothetical protein [Roseibacillus sp.]
MGYSPGAGDFSPLDLMGNLLISSDMRYSQQKRDFLHFVLGQPIGRVWNRRAERPQRLLFQNIIYYDIDTTMKLKALLPLVPLSLASALGA